MDIAALTDKAIEDQQFMVFRFLERSREWNERTIASNGCCRDCCETIPEARRQALPGCALCVECADRDERWLRAGLRQRADTGWFWMTISIVSPDPAGRISWLSTA